MSDDDLSSYIPHHGDRIRLRSRLRKQEKPQEKKNKLLTILQQKLELAQKKKSPHNTVSEEEEMRNPHRPFGNRNAVKQNRLIEIGWIHKTSQRSIQVRVNKGGGTRKLEVSKTVIKENIIEKAISLFFPNGMSAKGPTSDFNFDLWDFADRTIAPDITVADMYESTKMPILRFYLSTSQKNNNPINTSKMPESSATSPDAPNDKNTSLTYTSGESTVSQEDNQEGHHHGDIIHHAMEIAGLPMSDDDSLPDIFEQPALGLSDTKKSITLKLHRGHLLRELIDAFKNIDPTKDTVLVQMVMPDGRLEAAEDGGGVTRDALSDFWTSFYDQCTLGTKSKIPCLRHDFAEKEWQSVANIILFGWDSCRYIPIQLSLPFLQLCLYGRVSANILDAFFEVIPKDEAITLKNALSDWKLVDQDDLLDILELHECKTLPTSHNITRLLNEIAHKEIIQTSMFIVDCFQPILKQADIAEDRLIQLYSDLIPTPKVVNRMFKFPDPMCAEEQTVANHLRRLIRELKSETLRKFVRFRTGSDLMVSKEINVSFVNVSGLARRPIAHTCSCLLELSKTYESFPQFRSEFMAVLESNVWVMDII